MELFIVLVIAAAVLVVGYNLTKKARANPAAIDTNNDGKISVVEAVVAVKEEVVAEVKAVEAKAEVAVAEVKKAAKTTVTKAKAVEAKVEEAVKKAAPKKKPAAKAPAGKASDTNDTKLV